MPFSDPTKNAPESAATDFEGNENRTNTDERTDSAVTVPTFPTSAEVLALLKPDSSEMTNLVIRPLGSGLQQCVVVLDRHDQRDEDGTPIPAVFSLNFRGIDANYPEIHPSGIPALIDTLTEMHRAWLYLDPENFS